MLHRTIGHGLVIVALAAVAAGVAAQELVPQYPRGLLINFDPIIESHGGQRLHQVAGWNNPSALTSGYMADLYSSSHGLVKYRLVQTVNADVWPIKEDGFRYTDAVYLQCLATWSGWHQPDARDYKAVARDYDLARKVDAGMVDEVWDHSAPYFGGYETRMLGRGGYWCNSPAQPRIPCSKIFIVSVFNYERGVDCMLEDYGHRAESILRYTYGSWGPYMTHAWNRFTLYDKIYPGEAACGNVHFAPNSESDYDWGNPRYVWSTCQDWLENFPNLTGQKVWVNCTEWGNGDMRLHHIWWFSHMPHVAGSLTEYGMTRLNNWWEYMQDFNTHAESGGDHVPGGSPPPATPWTGPQRVLTANGRDDWFPRASAAGRVVWQGWDGTDFEIYARNMDGSGFVQITANAWDDEAPQINAAGRVVWQGFDGQDYEIFSANADGTDRVQITNNAWDDWHPQINDAGRIVWEGWDGNDYEIFSANADGTDVVQITDNGGVFPTRPREDVWPQINSASPARVVWFGYDGSDWEIFSARADGSELVNVSNNTREDTYPQLNGAGRVVWMSYHSDTNVEIYSANADGSNLVRLTNNTVEDWWPQISAAGQVVWMARVSGDWEIMTVAATGGTPQAVTANSTHDQYPQIDAAGRLAWQGFDGHDWEIYTRIDGTIFQVTDNDYDDRWPSLCGSDGLVWHADSAAGSEYSTSEIHAAGSPTHDVTPPTLTGVQATGPTTVRVTFSEPVEQTSAEDPANYAITPDVAVLGATLHSSATSVLLATTALVPDVPYTLTVSNVTDRASPPNPIAPGTQAVFTYGGWQRVTDGLVVLYGFNEGAGDVVHDLAESGAPLDLLVADPAAVAWQPDGLVLVAPTRVASGGPATKVITACKASNEITVEAWVAPAGVEQYGPARIVTVSGSTSARNFTLGQGLATAAEPRDVFDFRLRTTDTSGNGLPSLTTLPGSVQPALLHVVYTRAADGAARLYVDGTEAGSATISGTFATWNAGYALTLGNEPTGSVPWLGQYSLVAIYGRALDAAEVLQNYLAGPSLAPPFTPGDPDCDGLITFADIDPFVIALSGQAGYEAAYPDCNWLNADCNGDGTVDFGDIDPFVALLAGG